MSALRLTADKSGVQTRSPVPIVQRTQSYDVIYEYYEKRRLIFFNAFRIRDLGAISKELDMADLFENYTSGLESPATYLQAITPNDSADLAQVTRAICVGGEGFVDITTVSGSRGRVYVVPGAPFPVRARRIWASGTTASNIVALA